MLVKETREPRKMVLKQLLHSQLAMDLTAQRELTAEKSRNSHFAREISQKSSSQEKRHHAEPYQRTAVKHQAQSQVKNASKIKKDLLSNSKATTNISTTIDISTSIEKSTTPLPQMLVRETTKLKKTRRKLNQHSQSATEPMAQLVLNA